jgi:hypothetical protein
MARATKLAARYTPSAKNHNERCALCQHFQPPDDCSRVLGAISPQGWCRFFVRETKERGEP